MKALVVNLEIVLIKSHFEGFKEWTRERALIADNLIAIGRFMRAKRVSYFNCGDSAKLQLFSLLPVSRLIKAICSTLISIIISARMNINVKLSGSSLLRQLKSANIYDAKLMELFP